MASGRGGRGTSPESRALKPIAAGLSLAAVFTAVVAIPLEAAARLGLSPEETSAWIMVTYGLPSLVTILLILRYREPLLVTGNIFILIFVRSLGGDLSWPELVGATMVAGAVVLALGLSGLTHWLASILPAPIVHGVLAGAVTELLANAFTALGSSTLLVGTTLAAFFLSRAFLGDRVPALLVAIGIGVVVALLGGQTGPVPTPVWPRVAFTLPEFTWSAVLTATPIMVVFITLQANAPSLVYLKEQAYDPPERVISPMSGLGTAAGSFFGPMGVSLSLPATALTASPDAGDHEVRHWAGYLAASIGLLIAFMSGFATEVLEFIPIALLTAVVGLAVLGILSQAVHEIAKGPLLVGPLVAFAVSLSEIDLLGLGRFFWALTLGMAASLLLEREQWREIHGKVKREPIHG